MEQTTGIEQQRGFRANERFRWRTRVARQRPGPTLTLSTVRGARLRRLFFLSDVLGFVLALVAATLLHSVVGRSVDFTPLLISLVICAPAWFLIAHGVGLYHLPERRIHFSLADEIGPMFLVTTVWVWLLLLVSSLLMAGNLMLLWFFLMWLFAISFVLAGRIVVRRTTRDLSWYRQDVLIVGDGRGIDRVLRRIRRHPECGIDVVGTVHRSGSDSHAAPLEGASGADRVADAIASLGERTQSAGAIASLAKRAGIQRVIMTGFGGTMDDRTELMRVLATSGVYVDVVSGEPEALCAGASIHHLEGLPMMTVQPTTMTRTALTLKRVIDTVIAAAGLIVLAPLLLYVAVRIKLDSSGPALFRQSRAGRDGATFEVLKFRTMVEAADGQRDELRSTNSEGRDAEAARRPARDPVRRAAEAHVLDELPQLWNVLRGDMSLVGPRPLPLDEAPLAQGHFADRNRVRPGMTGPWQIHGRSDIPFEDMVKLDYTYVSSWSLQEDLRLLVQTASVVLSGRGAY